MSLNIERNLYFRLFLGGSNDQDYDKNFETKKCSNQLFSTSVKFPMETMMLELKRVAAEKLS